MDGWMQSCAGFVNQGAEAATKQPIRYSASGAENWSNLGHFLQSLVQFSAPATRQQGRGSPRLCKRKTNGETKQQQQQQQQQQQYKTWRRGTEGRRGHGHGAEDGSCRDIGVVNSNSAPGDFIAKRSVEFAATEGNSKQF